MRAPFPYFGAKVVPAPRIWSLLGKPSLYVEPFAGSCGVLLGRPNPIVGRELINDSDGLLVNAWRAIKHSPEELADLLQEPLTEIDLTARRAWLTTYGPDYLMGNPDKHSVELAAWWIYVVSGGIYPTLKLPGPWVISDDRLVKGAPGEGVSAGLPYLVARSGIFTYDNRDHLHQLMEQLQRRLRHVVITCGDWERVLTPSVTYKYTSPEDIGIFLDPPYRDKEGIYIKGETDIAVEVEDWCRNANPQMRIVLCGYSGDYTLPGWSQLTWKQGRRDTGQETYWVSPSCLPALRNRRRSRSLTNSALK